MHVFSDVHELLLMALHSGGCDNIGSWSAIHMLMFAEGGRKVLPVHHRYERLLEEGKVANKEWDFEHGNRLGGCCIGWRVLLIGSIRA